MSETYYVYTHKYKTVPNIGRVFYVGKGTGRRASDQWGRNPHWKRVVKKYGFDVSIYKDNMNEECAFTLEKILISIIGAENLTNITHGGEGVSGYKWTDENLLKRRKRVFCSNGMEFSGLGCAVKWLVENGHPSAARGCLSRTISGGTLTAYGYTWGTSKDDIPDFIDRHSTSSSSRSNTIYCSNGMVFNKSSLAIDWLNSIGVDAKCSSLILRCAKGRVKSAYGYTWSFNQNTVMEFVAPHKRSAKARSKKVRCSNGMIFDSLSDAATWLVSEGNVKMKATNVGAVVNGRYNTCCGYRWERYLD